MSLTRLTVYADPADLAIIKEAAARGGGAQSAIIRKAIHREAIHLAALGKGVRTETTGPDTG
ncbi:CopG family transcriptional regulator [Streptacidiphilus sp. EB129]|jgi:hypothetical protein|uniref:ribbon-helix-helix domain-containing protein n=1 Tax=Streptacidiphilus sp. EB129 TaxID=3156262 RepID=UPI003516D918